MKKQDILKEWAAEDPTVLKYKQEIKDLQESLKNFIKETESEIVREIDDLQIDIKLAIKGMSKGSPYKPAELKGYLFARAKDKVEETFAKAELFEKLDVELM